MKRKLISSLAICIIVAAMLPVKVFAMPITYTTTYADPADTPIFGTMIDPSGYYFGDGVGYTDPKTAGNSLDKQRVYILDWGYPSGTFQMMKWDMGFTTDFVRVYPDIENGFQADGHDYLEWSLWGSNNPAENLGAWTLLWDPTTASSVMKTNDDFIVTTASGSATSAKIYRYGTNMDVGTVPGDAYSDAFTIDFGLKDRYRYFGIRASTMAINAGDPDPEINAVATERQIEDAIAYGVAYLAGQQNPVDGSWGPSDDVKTAYTGLVLMKLQMYAYELNYTSPFDPAFPYSSNVIEGWVFIFSTDGAGNPLHAPKQPLSLQDHTGGASGTNDDPDTNGNGYGIYFAGSGNPQPVYTTGICLMALQASGTPNRANDGGIDYDGDGFTDTFKQIAQDATDWLAWAQGDSGNDEGGWGYWPLDNQMVNDWTDNSNGGYAVLGLAAAEGLGCTVPAWVRIELNVWITTIQDPVNGDPDDGGSYYNPDWVPGNPMVNELKAGNLIFQMTFYGDDPTVQRFKDVMNYTVRHWQDMNNDPGWGFGITPSNYQAMFCLMKGLEYSGIDLIDLDGNGTPEHDWYDEFATVLVSQQNPADGSWFMGGYGNAIIDTAWALLTLEKVAPPPPPVEHDIAVISVVPDVAHQYPGRMVNIEVVVKNKGNSSETFDVTAYRDSIPIGTIPVTNLGVGENTTLIFNWNTSGLTPCHTWTIKAEAPLSGDVNPSDNVLVNGTVKIKMLGDVNADGTIDLLDLVKAANAFDAVPGSTLWDPQADIWPDGLIDIFDLVNIALRFGQHC